ncbi:MAG: dienelactone hydrolase family protein [Chlamydiales bacterium]
MKEITFKCKDTPIKAYFSLPQLARGLVIFIHDTGSSRDSNQDQFIARVLERGGIGYLLFDLLTDKEEKQEMETQEYSKNLPFLTERVLAATRWVKEQEEFKDIPIGYLGVGAGSTAAFCASAIESSLKALVCLGAPEEPATSVLENILAPTLLLVGSKDHHGEEINNKILEKLTCEKALKLIGAAGPKFQEPGAIEITSMKTFNWFIVKFGGIPGVK